MTTALLISYSGVLGGAERVLLELGRSVDGEAVLACPPGALAEAARERGLRVLELRCRPLALRGSVADRARAALALAGHCREVRALVGDLSPGVVVACGTRPALALLCGPRIDAPVIFDHHDALPGPLIAAATRRAARRARLVLVPSAAIASELDTPATVIHPGVQTEDFSDIGVPAHASEVLVLGALVPIKRPELALEIVALARQRRPDVRVRFVGSSLTSAEDELRTRLRRRADAPDLAGSVEFAGKVQDVRAELTRASVLLHCADAEAFGLVLVEALAAGRPVIAPSSGGPAEIIDETCGRLYPRGDVKAAANALLELVEEPQLAMKLGRQGRERASERFDARRMRSQFADAIAEVVLPDRRSGPPLALLTVSRNSETELSALLSSVKRHLPSANLVVVDCASQDGSVRIAREAGALTVELSENLGFGRACNRGLEEVSAPVCVLLNPDTELVDDSLLELAAQAHASRCLIAPLVLNPDGSRQHTVHPWPASGNEVLRALLPYTRLGIAALAPWRAREPRRVGWAVGCAIAVRTELLRELSGFDERLFMYGEDLDLCLRAAQHGIETWFWPGARLIHHGAHATRREFGEERLERLAHARHEVLLRDLGRTSARLDTALQATTFLTRALARTALGRPTARERAQLRLALGLWRRPEP